jgi:hypothetical protein
MKTIHIKPLVFPKGYWDIGLWIAYTDDPDGKKCLALNIAIISGQIHIGIK